MKVLKLSSDGKYIAVCLPVTGYQLSVFIEIKPLKGYNRERFSNEISGGKIMLDESRIVKFNSRRHAGVLPVRTIPGHFATNHSHINYYVDLTKLKTGIKEAQMAADIFAMASVMQSPSNIVSCSDS